MIKYKPWLICLVAAFFFSYELVQLHMLNALSPFIMKELNLNATELTTLSSTYLLADVLFLIPAGILMDRFSVRKTILTALAICILGTFGFAVSSNLWQACLFHFLSGIGNAFCFLSCMLLAKGWFKEKSAFIMSFIITVGLLGGFIAQVPFSLLAQNYTWRTALVIDGVIGISIWLLNYLFVYEAEDSKQNKSYSSWEFSTLVTQLKQACLLPETWIGGLYTGLMNLPLMIISAMVGNLYLINVYNLDSTQASFAISMISLGTILGSSTYGWVSEKFGSKRKIMQLGALVSLGVFGYLLIGKSMNLTIISCLFFALGFFTSSQVLGYPLITDAAPQEIQGTAMGVAAVIIMGLAFILQPITGILLDWNHFGSGVSYAPKDFYRAFLIFPLAFIISCFLATKVKDKKEVVLVRK